MIGVLSLGVCNGLSLGVCNGVDGNGDDCVLGRGVVGNRGVVIGGGSTGSACGGVAS